MIPATCMMRVTGVAISLTLALTTDGAAQNPRLELGRRLRRFEIAWEAASTARRTAAVPALKTAVGSFFTLRQSEAARQLDNAWLAVRGEANPDALSRALIGSQLLASPLCAEAEAGSLDLRLKENKGHRYRHPGGQLLGKDFQLPP